jgi:hypothetical protein
MAHYYHPLRGTLQVCRDHFEQLEDKRHLDEFAHLWFHHGTYMVPTFCVLEYSDELEFLCYDCNEVFVGEMTSSEEDEYWEEMHLQWKAYADQQELDNQ